MAGALLDLLSGHKPASAHVNSGKATEVTSSDGAEDVADFGATLDAIPDETVQEPLALGPAPNSVTNEASEGNSPEIAVEVTGDSSEETTEISALKGQNFQEVALSEDPERFEGAERHFEPTETDIEAKEFASPNTDKGVVRLPKSLAEEVLKGSLQKEATSLNQQTTIASKTPEFANNTAREAGAIPRSDPARTQDGIKGVSRKSVQSEKQVLVGSNIAASLEPSDVPRPATSSVSSDHLPTGGMAFPNADIQTNALPVAGQVSTETPAIDTEGALIERPQLDHSQRLAGDATVRNKASNDSVASRKVSASETARAGASTTTDALVVDETKTPLVSTAPSGHAESSQPTFAPLQVKPNALPPTRSASRIEDRIELPASERKLMDVYQSGSRPEAVTAASSPATSVTSAQVAAMSLQGMGVQSMLQKSAEDFNEVPFDERIDPLATAQQVSRSSVPASGSSQTIPVSHQTQTTETARSIIVQIAQAGSPNGNDVIQIQLMPEELGAIQYRLAASEQGLTIVVSAERPETLELLKRNSSELLSEFANMGMDASNLSFEGDQSSDKEDGSSKLNGDSSLNGETESLPEIALKPLPHASVGVDIRL